MNVICSHSLWSRRRSAVLVARDFSPAVLPSHSERGTSVCPYRGRDDSGPRRDELARKNVLAGICPRSPRRFGRFQRLGHEQSPLGLIRRRSGVNHDRWDGWPASACYSHTGSHELDAARSRAVSAASGRFPSSPGCLCGSLRPSAVYVVPVTARRWVAQASRAFPSARKTPALRWSPTR